MQFLGAVTAPGQQSIVSELATRGDLQKVLKEFPKGYQEDIQENKLFRMAIGIARGMNYLHTSNPPIIHRDLSAKVSIHSINKTMITPQQHQPSWPPSIY